MRLQSFLFAGGVGRVSAPKGVLFVWSHTFVVHVVNWNSTEKELLLQGEIGRRKEYLWIQMQRTKGVLGARGFSARYKIYWCCLCRKSLAGVALRLFLFWENSGSILKNVKRNLWGVTLSDVSCRTGGARSEMNKCSAAVSSSGRFCGAGLSFSCEGITYARLLLLRRQKYRLSPLNVTVRSSLFLGFCAASENTRERSQSEGRPFTMSRKFTRKDLAKLAVRAVGQTRAWNCAKSYIYFDRSNILHLLPSSPKNQVFKISTVFPRRLWRQVKTLGQLPVRQIGCLAVWHLCEAWETLGRCSGQNSSLRIKLLHHH